MDRKRQLVADLLFGVQIICTITFGATQFVRLLSTSEGISLSWYLFWEVFLILNLVLTVRAHKVQPSRVTLQAVICFSLWLLVITADIGAVLWRKISAWDAHDTMTTILAGSGILVTLIWAHQHKLNLKDPIIKGLAALCLKAIPQLMMAWKIICDGNSGLPGLTLLAGHLTILASLGLLSLSKQEALSDRNRTGSLISQIGNQLSWIVVTITWLIVWSRTHTREQFAEIIHWSSIIWIVGFVNVVAMLPQLYQIVRTRRTEGLNLTMFMVILLIQASFSLHGFFQHDTMLMFCQGLSACTTLGLIIFVSIVRQTQQQKN